MSSSREGTPDWLSSFQAPTHPAITLSSDSECSSDDRFLGVDIINKEEPSACETSQFSKNKDQNMLVNVEESVPFKNSKSKMKRKQLNLEDDMLVKKKKTEGREKKGKARGGNEFDVDAAEEETFGKHVEPHLSDSTLWTLSSDSESCPDEISIKEVLLRHKEASLCKTSRNQEKREDEGTVLTDSGVKTLIDADSKVEKSMEKRLELENCPAMRTSETNTQQNMKGGVAKLEVKEEATVPKPTEPPASSSRVPLMLAEKVHLSKALVECDGESIDLSGDMGSVGRIVISDKSHEMLLDLKGTIYKTTIVPSRTFCVVSFGQSEAKIEAVMNDFIQLKPQSNVYEAETMVEGTLEGFSFDSEDETDKMAKAVAGQIDKEEEGAKGQTNSKLHGKTEKASGVAQKKKGKTAGGKPQKKVRKKAQVPKKGKAKK